MTTDTKSKIISLHAEEGYNIIGIAKGSGMIAPNMATMLAVIATDAIIPDHITSKIPHLWDQSFNRIVVDGDMSTNDTVLLLANGSSNISASGDNAFEEKLNKVCTALAKAIVSDGEGATKLVKVSITGASAEVDAEKIARAIATSPLCKTAFYGADPNWGRIICAAGYAGVDLQVDQLMLWLKNGEETILLYENAQPTTFDEVAAVNLMNNKEWTVHLDLGMGSEEYWLWTCDLSHEYITINGHYRT